MLAGIGSGLKNKETVRKFVQIPSLQNFVNRKCNWWLFVEFLPMKQIYAYGGFLADEGSNISVSLIDFTAANSQGEAEVSAVKLVVQFLAEAKGKPDSDLKVISTSKCLHSLFY